VSRGTIAFGTSMADTKRPTFEHTLPLHQKGKEPASEEPPPSSSERWEADDMMKTVRLASSPEITIPRAPAAPGIPATSIELVVVEESQLPGGERKPWRAAEVWTKRRVYGLDSTFKCVEILDRETGRTVQKHEMLGARLGGGRRREKDRVRFSYPLPLPGTEAMFMKGKKHGYTSVVERMIVRVRVLDTGVDEVSPSWDDIASRWSEPPPQ
jgi:hypothetical protein